MACCHFKKIEEVAKGIRFSSFEYHFFIHWFQKFAFLILKYTKYLCVTLVGCGAGVEVGRHQEKSEQSLYLPPHHHKKYLINYLKNKIKDLLYTFIKFGHMVYYLCKVNCICIYTGY